MTWFKKPRIVSSSPESFSLRFNESERETLRNILQQIQKLFQEKNPLDPRLRRAFPVAYSMDQESETEYQRLMQDDLFSSRLASIDLVISTIDKEDISYSELLRWMQALNSTRLVLGTILDVSEDDDRTSLPEEDPLYSAAIIFDFLGMLLDEITRTLQSNA
jgi:hypothetical protein